MSVRGRPNYGIYKIDLSVTGSQDLPLLGTRVVFITALQGATFGKTATGDVIVTSGTVAPSTIVNLLLGKALGDAIPMTLNASVNVDNTFEFARLAWFGQPGVTAFFLVDDDRAGAGLDMNSPAAILGGTVSLIGGTGNVASVTAALALQVDGSNSPPSVLSASGTTFFDFSSGIAAVNTALVPANNVNGAIIQTMIAETSAAIQALWYTGTAAPASSADTGKPSIGGLGVAAIGRDVLAQPLKLPAGFGLFSAVSGAGSRMRATWRLL